MMKHQLSFATITRLTDSIAEIIVNKDVEISLEMTEEFHQFLVANFNGDFGILVNKIYHYTYAFEAKLTLGSASNMKAIAVVFYNQAGSKTTDALLEVRAQDGLNLKLFSGLELGIKQGLDWLKEELSATCE
ncbi:MAG: hypothetical protein JKX90_04735 [Colwellia sp.]|jgi:hypothetical protein|nr:hypothetical protein [Colwellia sp.]